MQKGCHSCTMPSTKACQVGWKEEDRNGTFPSSDSNSLSKWKIFCGSYQRCGPYISLAIDITGSHAYLWQREKRFLGLMSRSRYYSASRLCTLPCSQNVGSISLGGTGNGCWVDHMGICHLHSSHKSFVPPPCPRALLGARG